MYKEFILKIKAKELKSVINALSNKVQIIQAVSNNTIFVVVPWDDYLSLTNEYQS